MEPLQPFIWKEQMKPQVCHVFKLKCVIITHNLSQLCSQGQEWTSKLTICCHILCTTECGQTLKLINAHAWRFKLLMFNFITWEMLFFLLFVPAHKQWVISASQWQRCSFKFCGNKMQINTWFILNDSVMKVFLHLQMDFTWHYVLFRTETEMVCFGGVLGCVFMTNGRVNITCWLVVPINQG